MNAIEFERMMEDVDAELRTENVRIDRRQIEGFSRVCDRLKAELTLAPLREPAIPGKYEGDSLSAHILNWFAARYGNRLNTDFSVGHVAIVIRNDPWRLYIPRVMGSVAFVCDRNLAAYRGRPSFYSGRSRQPPQFNILNGIQDFPDGLAAALEDNELNNIAEFFISACQSTCALEEILDRPFITEARDDLRSAVDVLLAKPTPNFGFSKWSSLQFTEKLLKSFLQTRPATFKLNHNLFGLSDLAENHGLVVDRQAIAAIQCAAAIRYDSSGVSASDAIAAHHQSLSICRQVARAISGRPEQVEWNRV